MGVRAALPASSLIGSALKLNIFNNSKYYLHFYSDMKFEKILTLLILLLLIILIARIIVNQNMKKTDCSISLQDFDNFIEKSNLSIIENPDALCYGLNMGSDFSEIDSKWAIGRLVNVSHDSQYYSLTFEGLNKKGVIFIPLSEEVSDYIVGDYYKVDMNNICRHFFILADSRYPSPIASTFIKPEKIDCK